MKNYKATNDDIFEPIEFLYDSKIELDYYYKRNSYKLSYNSNTELNHFEFLGMLMGICIRTGVHILLDLASIIWKKIADTPISKEDIKIFHFYF